MKRLVFKRAMMQRYRAITHFIDPLIQEGYNLTIEVQSDKFDFKKMQEMPMNASKASKKSVQYLMKNFGIKCKHIDKVHFVLEKNKAKGLLLSVDDKTFSKDYMSLPYTSFYCNDNGVEQLTGNPMCSLLREYQNDFREEKKTLLLIHPGGGRGYISPVRSHIPKKDVIKNHIKLLKRIVKQIPDSIKKITLKTHPVPYLFCGEKGINKHVIGEVQKVSPCPIEVVQDGLMLQLARHEFIVNLGSSSTIWLLGSDKKWINLRGLAKFSYQKHRDHRERTENWFDWPQHTKLDGLKSLILNYEDEVFLNKKNAEIREKYKKIYRLNAVESVMDLIRERTSH